MGDQYGGYTDLQNQWAGYALGQAQNDHLGPMYNRWRKDAGAFRRGDDSKGRLTNWLAPERLHAGVVTQGIVDAYDRENAPAFNQGGGTLTANNHAAIRLEGMKNAAEAEIPAFMAHGEGYGDRAQGAYLASEGIKQGYAGIGASIANNPQQKQMGFWQRFALGALSGGSSIAAAAAGKP